MTAGTSRPGALADGHPPPAIGVHVRHDVIDAVTSIDRLVFGDVWSAPDDPAARAGLVRAAVQHHIDRNPAYRRYCERTGFSVTDLAGPDDLAAVPQLPTPVFKLGVDVRSCAPHEVAKRCTSSGTSGRLSVVDRDRSTLERLMGSVRAGIELMGTWQDDEVAVLNLGPDQHEAGDLWFAYVMSLVELDHEATHAVRDGHLDLPASFATLSQLRRRLPTVVVIGAPVLVQQLAAFATEEGQPDGEGRVHVVTAGGWKRHAGEAIDRAEFDEFVADRLDLVSEVDIRDAFNQVELNTVLMECAAQRKHVPPWLEVIVRDPATLEPVPAGSDGLLSYLDPTAGSYPGFIVGEDLGAVLAPPCSCGWHGRTLRYRRRLEREEDWGCALKLDRDVTTDRGAR